MTAARDVVPGLVVRHATYGIFTVIALAEDHWNGSRVVVYRSHAGKVLVQPLSEFAGNTEDGRPRYEIVDSCGPDGVIGPELLRYRTVRGLVDAAREVVSWTSSRLASREPVPPGYYHPAEHGLRAALLEFGPEPPARQPGHPGPGAP